MATLKPLTEVASPSLVTFDRDSLVTELVERIQSDESWSSLWDGELLQNFSYFIISTFAYMFEKNAESANRTLRENFVTVSKDPQSLVNYLSNYNLSLQQSSASVATVRCRPADGSSFTRYFTLPAGFVLNGVSYSGNPVRYELYNLEPNGKLNYRSPVEVFPRNFVNYTAYSGTTVSETYTLNNVTEREKFIYNLSNAGVLHGSLRVYYEYNTLNEVELIETDSFVVSPVVLGPFTANSGGVPHYKLLYNSDGTTSVLFGTSRFGGAFPSSGGTITFVYRTGGGSSTNVPPGGLNYTTSVSVDGVTTLSVNFNNTLAGGAGSDTESVDEARYYAPYRVGRGRSIVDETDVLNTLRKSVVKHKVQSPQYNTYTVPVLHYHNYVVPPRDFNSFSFPTPESYDNPLSYKVLFEQSLNDYCNLQGLHDGVENDVLVSNFRATNFSFPLPLKPILNSSLSVSAYDVNGIEVDRLQFSGNYASSNENYPDEPNVSASVVTPNAVPALGVTLNNNKVKFKVDSLPTNYVPPVGSTVTTAQYYEVTVPVGTYSLDSNNKNTALAEAINTAVRSADPYYSSFPSSRTFVSVDSNGKFVFSSLITGEYSSVQLFTTSDSLLSTLGYTSQKVYANPQSRKVFLQTSLYDSTSEEVFVSLNNSSWSTSDLKYDLVPPWASGTVLTGPTLAFNIVDSDGTTVRLQEGVQLTVQALQNSVVVDTVTFSSVLSNVENYGVASTGLVFDDANPQTCLLDYVTSTLTLKLTDSNGTEGEYSYPTEADGVTQLYNQSTVFNVSYSKKVYGFVTVSYNPNPYHNEGEALGYSSLLKSSDKKQMLVEPLLKKVRYVPVGLELFVKPSNGYTRQQAVVAARSALFNLYQYSNSNPNSYVGSGFSVQSATSELNNKLRYPELQSVRFVTPALDYVDNNGNEYYFVLPENFLLQLQQQEVTYPQLSGLSNYYTVKVLPE